VSGGHLPRVLNQLRILKQQLEDEWNFYQQYSQRWPKDKRQFDIDGDRGLLLNGRPESGGNIMWEYERVKEMISVTEHLMATENENTQTRSSSESGFSHGPDYRHVSLSGNDFSLTTTQAKIIEFLHAQYLAGHPEVSGYYILEQVVDTPSTRLVDIFKKNSTAYKALIRPGKTKGSVCLNVFEI